MRYVPHIIPAIYFLAAIHFVRYPLLPTYLLFSTYSVPNVLYNGKELFQISEKLEIFVYGTRYYKTYEFFHQ